MKVALRIAGAFMLLAAVWYGYYAFNVEVGAENIMQQLAGALYYLVAFICFGFGFVLLGISSLIANSK